MVEQNFIDSMDQVSEAFNNGDYDISFNLSSKLKETLLLEETPDPIQLGWAKFYQFKSLYESGRNAEALNLLNSTESSPFAVSSNNAAYMESVGTELAMKLNLSSEIIIHGNKCLEICKEINDHQRRLNTANNICMMLNKINKDELNENYAKILLEESNLENTAEFLFISFDYLFAHLKKLYNEELFLYTEEKLNDLILKDTPHLQIFAGHYNKLKKLRPVDAFSCINCRHSWEEHLNGYCTHRGCHCMEMKEF